MKVNSLLTLFSLLVYSWRSNTMTKLAFVSDIHWRGITRHEEYTQAFTELYRQLREEVKPDYILCGGDIFHTKTMGITPK